MGENLDPLPSPTHHYCPTQIHCLQIHCLLCTPDSRTSSPAPARQKKKKKKSALFIFSASASPAAAAASARASAHRSRTPHQHRHRPLLRHPSPVQIRPDSTCADLFSPSPGRSSPAPLLQIRRSVALYSIRSSQEEPLPTSTTSDLPNPQRRRPDPKPIYSRHHLEPMQSASAAASTTCCGPSVACLYQICRSPLRRRICCSCAVVATACATSRRRSSPPPLLQFLHHCYSFFAIVAAIAACYSTAITAYGRSPSARSRCTSDPSLSATDAEIRASSVAAACSCDKIRRTSRRSTGPPSPPMPQAAHTTSVPSVPAAALSTSESPPPDLAI